jgi:VanZ family protein
VKLWLARWTPVIVWMAVIFSASSDRASFQHSSRIIGPLVRWLFPQLSEDSVYAIVFAVRKLAHLTEYAILAILLWLALRDAAELRRWRWSDARVALLLVALYAASDELHQTFVPSRQGAVIDVALDTSGGAFGLLFLWGFGRWRKWW